MTAKNTVKKTTTKKKTKVKRSIDTVLEEKKTIPPIKTVNAWEVESYRPALNQPDKTEGAYKFNTQHGAVYIKPQDIMHALEEQANSTDEEIVSPEVDLQGWGIVHATDESGNSRPLLLMRVLPAPALAVPYDKVRNDDKAMQELIMKEVYKLTPTRIKWIKFKHKIVTLFNRIKTKQKTNNKNTKLNEAEDSFTGFNN